MVSVTPLNLTSLKELDLGSIKSLIAHNNWDAVVSEIRAALANNELSVVIDYLNALKFVFTDSKFEEQPDLALNHDLVELFKLLVSLISGKYSRKLVFYALYCLTNIAFCTSMCADLCFFTPIIQVTIRYILTETFDFLFVVDVETVKQATWLLGNIIGDCQPLAILCESMGVWGAIHKIYLLDLQHYKITGNDSLLALKYLWVLCNIVRYSSHHPIPSFVRLMFYELITRTSLSVEVLAHILYSIGLFQENPYCDFFVIKDENKIITDLVIERLEQLDMEDSMGIGSRIEKYFVLFLGNLCYSDNSNYVLGSCSLRFFFSRLDSAATSSDPALVGCYLWVLTNLISLTGFSFFCEQECVLSFLKNNITSSTKAIRKETLNCLHSMLINVTIDDDDWGKSFIREVEQLVNLCYSVTT
ncbi:hypothetical protein PCE1_003768 [Barthelona sp. PCE]